MCRWNELRIRMIRERKKERRKERHTILSGMIANIAVTKILPKLFKFFGNIIVIRSFRNT
jgi:hypothetical protein